MLEQHFAPDQDEAEIEENIETFMQNTQLLIDNHFELQGIMLSVLAKLSIIKHQNFGVRCFNALKDLMKSGRQMEEQVNRILQEEVIKKLKLEDQTAIPVSLLIGLGELVADTGNPGLLTELYEMSFPVWLQQYCRALDACKSAGTLMGNHDHYDAVVSLLSISVTADENSAAADENVEKVLDKDIIPYITQIIKASSRDHKRYIPCLTLIARLSNAESKAANLFMDSLVHTILIEQITRSLNIYKKNNSLFDESSQETVEQQMLKYQTLAAEIRCLGGLLQAGPGNRASILEKEKQVVLDLIQIMRHPKTDPILLTAICTFALDLFECDELRWDATVMEPFYEKMSNMKYMIPYLGFDMYNELLMMTRRYHQASDQGKRANDNAAARQDARGNAAHGQSEADGDEGGAKHSQQQI